MAKKSQGLFAHLPPISAEVAPRRVVGEPTDKITVALLKRQTVWLDELALALRKHTGHRVRRVELIRSLVENASRTYKLTETASLNRAARELLGDEAAAVH